MVNKPDRNILMDWVVLVIDDDPGSLDIAAKLLKHYGAIVYTADQGERGLAVLKDITPRFIISDLSMPIMDGWVFISRVKSDPKLKEIPVIALTAHAMVGDRERAIAAGYNNYLTKPLSPATFMSDLVALLVDIPELNLNYS